MSENRLFQTDYDRSSCEIGMVHLGFGAFHRAHQAVYIDDYMQKTGDLRWGIAAVNLRRADAPSFHAAARADEGYVLKTIAPDGTIDFRLVRSHLAFFDASDDDNGNGDDSAYDLLCRPSVHTVSITVTESGYYVDQDWALDLTAGPVAEGLSGRKTETVYAYLAEALARRAQTLNKPLTIMCCDNIRSNGEMLEKALRAYLMAMGKTELADWVEQNVSFPCSMVDRITPRSTSELCTEVSERFGSDRLAPVHSELFTQWVVEHKFASEMPDLSEVGVELVSDVLPYEEAKIRILNGGHTALAYLGALSGHVTFDQAMRDPHLRAHFDKWEEAEVLEGLDDSIPFDTSHYLGEIAARFENRGIADHLERICMDGYSKMAIYIRPTLEACLQKGIEPEAGFDCVASWIVNARRFRNGTSAIPYHEPYWDRLEPMIAPGREEEIASDPHIWGDLPERFNSFVPSLVAAIHRMDEKWQA